MCAGWASKEREIEVRGVRGRRSKVASAGRAADAPAAFPHLSEKRTVPVSFLAHDRSRMMRAISTTSSRFRLPLCLMSFSCGGREREERGKRGVSQKKKKGNERDRSASEDKGRDGHADGLRPQSTPPEPRSLSPPPPCPRTFLRSRRGSLSALMTSAAALGTTLTFATRFCTDSLTVTRRPFHSLAVSLAMSSPIFLGDRPSGPILGASEEAAPTSPPVARTKTSIKSLGSNLGGMAVCGEREGNEREGVRQSGRREG